MGYRPRQKLKHLRQPILGESPSINNLVMIRATTKKKMTMIPSLRSSMKSIMQKTKTMTMMTTIAKRAPSLTTILLTKRLNTLWIDQKIQRLKFSKSIINMSHSPIHSIFSTTMEISNIFTMKKLRTLSRNKYLLKVIIKSTITT